jgi:hypothetical protein
MPDAVVRTIRPQVLIAVQRAPPANSGVIENSAVDALHHLTIGDDLTAANSKINSQQNLDIEFKTP